VITTAEKNVDSWEAEAARLKQLIADFEMQISITPEDTEDVSEEEKAVENAKNALTAAQNELTAAENAKAALEAEKDYLVTISGSDGSHTVIEDTDDASYSSGSPTLHLNAGVKYSMYVKLMFPSWYDNTFMWLDDFKIVPR